MLQIQAAMTAMFAYLSAHREYVIDTFNQNSNVYTIILLMVWPWKNIIFSLFMEKKAGESNPFPLLLKSKQTGINDRSHKIIVMLYS